MSSEPAVSIRGISKVFAIYAKPSDRLRQSVLPRLQRLTGRPPGRYYREFWALRDVTLDIRRGEALGVVGRNGAGKSTLLQIVCGTLTPTDGEVRTNGRIAGLLELGSGFNPEFSGLENVYLNAALLGFSRDEIEARRDDILGFADIGDFVSQPVKTYSSGMMVRLAFAVQAQLDPDVLVVDEALAVGDARFQAKCFARLRALRDRGTTILFVTHSTEQVVAHCDRAVLIDGGRLIEAGEPRHIVNRYLDLLFGRTAPPAIDAAAALLASDEPTTPVRADGADDLFRDPGASGFETRPTYNPHEYRWGDGRARILDHMLLVDDKPVQLSIPRGARLRLLIKLRFLGHVQRPILGLTLKTREGVSVYGTNSEMLSIDGFGALGDDVDNVHVATFEFEARLAGGDYFISLGIASRDGVDVVPHDRRYDAIHFVVETDASFFGIADLLGRGELQTCRMPADR